MARIRNHLKMRVLMKFQREFIDGLKKANLAKNRIIGIASHDLRNPIASIRGLSEFLEEAGPLTPDQREIAMTIQSTSDSMLHLVDELLDLSVIESGEERSEREPCSIYEIVSSSLNIYQFTANKKSIKLNLRDEGEIPELLLLDKMQFRRLVDNVLSNAVKYSPTDTAVDVNLCREGHLMKIVVQDQGRAFQKVRCTNSSPILVRRPSSPLATKQALDSGFRSAKKLSRRTRVGFMLKMHRRAELFSQSNST